MMLAKITDLINEQLIEMKPVNSRTQAEILYIRSINLFTVIFRTS